MGNILARPTSNPEKLDRLAEAINRSEEFCIELQQKKRLWIENLITYGTGLYLLVGCIIYVSRSGETPDNRNLCLFWFALYPVALVIVKEFVIWIFNLRLDNVKSKVSCLKNQRREIMRDIIKTKPFAISRDGLGNSEDPTPPKSAEKNLIFREGPILPPRKGLLEMLLEFIAGEGCCRRFALICSKCSTHNGLTLGEEYDYISFQCYNCHFLNPARKIRPPSPRLVLGSLAQRRRCDHAHGEDKAQNKIIQQSSFRESRNLMVNRRVFS